MNRRQCINVFYKEKFLGIPFGKLFESWEKRFETGALDEFRDHVGTSVRMRQKSLQVEWDCLTGDQFLDPGDIEGYRVHLGDQMNEAGDVQRLADELCIVALYRQVELHTKRVATKNFSTADVDRLLNYSPSMTTRPFDITALPDFAAFNELRLINNAIKHQGKVSGPLSENFPKWVLDSEFRDIGAAYSRLMPLVKNYMYAFVSSAYESSDSSMRNLE